MRRAHDPSRRTPREEKPPAKGGAVADPRLTFLGLPNGVGNREIGRQARTLARETKEKEKRVTIYLGDPRPKPQPPPPAEAVKRATPENRKVAELIDAMEKLSDADLLKARGEAAQGAVRPGYPSGQEAEQQKLNAIEFLVQRRRLGPLKISDASVHDPTQRRLYVRMLIEEGLSKKLKSRTGGSFRKALADFTHTKEIESDIEWFERDAGIFRKEFHNQARETARKMLDASLQAMGKVLTDYGLQAGSAVRAAQEIYKGASVKDKAADLIGLAKQSKHVDDKAFEVKRESLAKTVKGLKDHQANVAFWRQRSRVADNYRPMSGEGPDWEAAEKAKRDYAAARAHLQAAWIEAEREHPIIAAFRRGEGVEKVDLGTLDKDPVADEMREVLLKVLPKMVDIIKVAYLVHIGPDQHGISPLALAPVVAATRANMFIPEGSIRAGIVKDMVDEATDEPAWVMVAAVALAIVTLIPSGGASTGLIAVAGAGFAAYSAAHAWQQYDTQKSLANTDLDLARSLSTVEPTLTGFAVSLVSLGIEGIPLIGAFNKARRIKALLNEGDHVAANALVRELNADGKPYGTNTLGDQAREEAEWARRRAAAAERDAAEAEAAAKKSKGTHATEPPPKKPAATEHVTPPPRDPLHKLGHITEYKTEAELRAAIRKSADPDKLGRGLEQMDHGAAVANPMMADLRETIKNHLASVTKDNPELIADLERVYAKLRDPKFVEDAIVDLWKEAGRRKISVRQALEERMAQGGKISDIRKELPPDKFREIMAKPEPIRDLEFAQDWHGAHTHMFQEYMVDRVLGAGEGRKFRQLIAKAKGPDVVEKAYGNKPRPFFSAVWDGLFDDGFGKGHINHPETLGRLLQEHLGLPRWQPPPP